MTVGIAHCPVCDQVDDCAHRLVEWYGWPGQRLRGSLCDLLRRIEASVGRLLLECSLANVPPRHTALMSAFEAGAAVVEGIRDAAAAGCSDEEEWERAYRDAEIDLDEVMDELRGYPTDFVTECLRAAPGVTMAVRQHLLDLMAPLEVQLEQLEFGRGRNRSPGSRT